MVVLSYKGRVTKNKKIKWKIPLLGLEKNKLEYFWSTFCSPLHSGAFKHGSVGF